MGSMSLLGADARYILETEKRVAKRLEWQPASSSRVGCARRVAFESRISLKGMSLPRGIWFRASVIPQYAGQATFQIECENPGTKSHIPLFRMEWRPMRSHKNGSLGPDELQGLFIDEGVTHAHSCIDHLDIEADEVLSGGVHTARIVTPDPATYDEALIWFCTQTRIVNPGDIPPPPAQGEMF
jgi:hypothetical protein